MRHIKAKEEEEEEEEEEEDCLRLHRDTTSRK